MSCTVVDNQFPIKKPICSFAAKQQAVNFILQCMAGKCKSRKYDKYNLAVEFEIWDDSIQNVIVQTLSDWYIKGYEAQIDYDKNNPWNPNIINQWAATKSRRYGPKASDIKMKNKDAHYQAFALGWHHAFCDSAEMNGGKTVTDYKLF